MNKQAIQLRQFDLGMYLLTLTVKELVDITYVDVFNSQTEEGYQRPSDPNHYKKITKYLQSENTPILPPTILTAINEELIEYSNGSLEIKGKLRLVDGQHRIEGFKYLKELNYERFKELENMELPVTLMSIKNNNKLYEINTFIDINSKGKKVSTDLAIRLRDSLRNQLQFYKSKHDLIESISTKTAIYLNSRDPLSVWYDSIKISPECKGKIISINAFCKSLNPLIENLIDEKQLNINLVNNDVLTKLVEEAASLVNRIWDIIEIKWHECFSKYYPKYNKNYNLQKGTGTYSVHLLMHDILVTSNVNINKALIIFENIILDSKVTSSDWVTGGTFSGYSSQSGIKYIISKVKNM